MRGILRTGLIGFVVLGSVTVADEVRATPGAVVAVGTVWEWTMDGAPRSHLDRSEPLLLNVVRPAPCRTRSR
jgi:hypothetical protein